MYADNGTNFLGAHNELEKLKKLHVDQDKITDKSRSKSIKWHFNTPLAPHCSGVHEVWVISKFNGTSTPKRSYNANTGVKLPYESKQSPLEKNVLVKWVQSPR